MTDRRFRFGVVAAPYGDAAHWRATARRAADLGYDTLLVPDGLQLLAPGPALAMAAATADIRIGTWVYAAPLRPPYATAWEAHSLTVLTDGRFEMGIGTGRPRRAGLHPPSRPALRDTQRAVGAARGHHRHSARTRRP